MRQTVKLVIPTLAMAALLAACGSSSSSSTTPAAAPAPGSSASAIVKTASNAKLGATILVDASGLTLYHLSGEQNGKWICTTTGCLQAWHPLTAPTGGTPSGGVASLGTIRRPDGTMQVTYKGMPLYTFSQDHKPGDASGQGIKDVGTWTAATTATVATSKPASPPPKAPSSGGGGYGY